jgi:hypothetical protein
MTSPVRNSSKTKVYATAIILLGPPDHQAFAGRFHDFLAYFPQLSPKRKALIGMIALAVSLRSQSAEL